MGRLATIKTVGIPGAGIRLDCLETFFADVLEKCLMVCSGSNPIA
jgi:hypothetical protein